MRRWLSAFPLLLLLAACQMDPCDEKSGQVLCGYCDQDAVTSSNPHAGMCRYCDGGTTCSGDVCSDNLACLAPPDGGGGGGNTCGTGRTCINNLCSPGLWCCLSSQSCSGCGCR